MQTSPYKPEILFVLIIMLVIPILLIFNGIIQEATKPRDCVSIIYVDIGFPYDDLDILNKTDTSICENRCNANCHIKTNTFCKGVYDMIFNDYTGVLCVCEVSDQKKEFADRCIEPKTNLVS